MKIAKAEVIVCCPGRNFVTLKLTTEDGVTGVGDATLNGRELAVASYLEDHVCPLLIGKDANRIEDMWQYLYKGAYWRRGPVTMVSIGAVDVALWDIKGKVAGLPVYELIGGRSRDGVMVYGHANGTDTEAVLEEVGKFLDSGYKAVRAQVGVPGLKAIYGVSKDKLFYEPAIGDLPEEADWSTSAYMHAAPKMLEKVRETYGFDFHLLHDAHHRLTPIEAAEFGKRLEPMHMYWLEDPTPAELQEGFRVIREHTTTPIAVGEVFNSIWDCEHLIKNQLIDYIRVAPTHAGGISHVRKIYSLAEMHHVRTGPHGATDLSPICFSAAVHLDVSVPNFGVQEYMFHSEETNEVFPHSYYLEDGYLQPGDEPGLGVDIDVELAKKFPYKRAYLPVNRLLDGSMHSW
jgi:mannonate dehydratase